MIMQNHPKRLLKHRLATVIFAALGAALLSTPSLANDPAPCVDGAYFSGHAYLCSFVPGTATDLEGKPPQTWIENAVETWRVETGYDCTTGTETITWDMLLNKGGKGELWGEILMEPDYTSAGWFEELIYVKGGKTVKTGSYTGYGAFADYVVDYQIVRSKYVPPVSPCDGGSPPLHILDYTGYVYIDD